MTEHAAHQDQTPATPPALPDPQHHFIYHDTQGVARALPSPAPNYRAGDNCDYSALITTPQVRPLVLTDMIPFVIYRPGSVLFSRFHARVRHMVRIVGWVEPDIRSDKGAVLAAFLAGQAAQQRTSLRTLLVDIYFREEQGPADWSLTIPEIEQSKITTMIL